MQIRTLSTADLTRCPKTSLLPAHYRDDGSCLCNERAEAKADVVRLRTALAAARMRYHRC
jgi:hypothetical protein